MESLVVTSDGSQNKKRRKLLATGLDIEPYRKKPKILFSSIIPQSDEIRNDVPTSLLSAMLCVILRGWANAVC